MKRSIVWLIVITLALAGCKARETVSGSATETIAPAQPKPATTDSDAMTQTVDIEGGRSDAEGGVLSSTSTTVTATTATTQTTTTTTAPPPTTTTR